MESLQAKNIISTVRCKNGRNVCIDGGVMLQEEESLKNIDYFISCGKWKKPETKAHDTSQEFKVWA